MWDGCKYKIITAGVSRGFYAFKITMRNYLRKPRLPGNTDQHMHWFSVSGESADTLKISICWIEVRVDLHVCKLLFIKKCYQWNFVIKTRWINDNGYRHLKLKFRWHFDMTFSPISMFYAQCISYNLSKTIAIISTLHSAQEITFHSIQGWTVHRG